MTNKHSHPILGGRTPEKRTEPRSDIKPVEEFPVNVPSYISDDPTQSIRRSRSEIEYADPSILQDVQSQCKDVVDRFPNKAVLFVGSEEYDYPTITILEGLQDLGFTIYTLKKPNINSWFCNQVIDSTSGLKIDFALFNVGWGTRWSYYNRYQLRRFPIVLINSTRATWLNALSHIHISHIYMEVDKSAPDDADTLDIQPYRWAEMPSSSYAPDVLFSLYISSGGLNLPLGIHREFSNLAGTLSKVDRSTDLVGIVSLQEATGELIVPVEVAKFVSNDLGIHQWQRWANWKGGFDLLNSSAMYLANTGINHESLWKSLACGCLPFIPDPKTASAYQVTDITPFTVYKSQDELTDKVDWLTEHPDLLNRLRQDCETLAIEYFTPAPLAKRFLHLVREMIK